MYFPTNFDASIFLDALASLDLLIAHSLTDSLTERLEIDSPIPPQFSSLRLRHQPVTQNGMSLKMECHSKWNVTQNGMSLKMECHSKWNVTQNRMTLKMECHSNGMSPKMECNSKWNVT